MEKKNNEEKPETRLQVFIRNYKNVKGFRLLVKTAIYLLFFIIIVISMNLLLGNKMPKQYQTTTTTTTVAIDNNYNNMLDRLLDKSEFTCNIKINDKTYSFTGEYGNKILIGNINDTKFKIIDNKVYVITNNQEVENNEILKDVDLSIILNDTLVNTIKNSSGIITDKTDNSSVMKYDHIMINDKSYTIKVLRSDRINSIELNSNDNYVYKLEYNN